MGQFLTGVDSAPDGDALALRESLTKGLYVFPMGKKEFRWEVIRLKASPAALVGYLDAPDEQGALKRRFEEFRYRRRLLIRHAG